MGKGYTRRGREGGREEKNGEEGGDERGGEGRMERKKVYRYIENSVRENEGSKRKMKIKESQGS